MAIYHCQIKNIGRSSGRSAVACSAYRSASEMQDEELGKKFDYTKKQGVEYSNVILCANAPREYADREILWNEVHKVEKAKDARLAREFEVALPNELTPEQAQELTDRFAKSLADEGMCVDYSIHNPQKKDKNQNRHAHIMATTRQITEKGEWDTKYKKVYANDRDEQGKPIFNPDKGQSPEDRIPQLNEDGTQKVRIRKGKGEEKLWERVNVQYNEWDKREKIGEWRERWANYTNEALEQAQSQERVTHLSFKAQGKEELPTIHEGYSTVKKEINEEIREYNSELHKLNHELEFYGKIRDLTLDKLAEEREEQAHERVGESSKRVGTAIQETAGTEQKIAEYGRTLETGEREREEKSRQFTDVFGDVALQIAGIREEQQRISQEQREVDTAGFRNRIKVEQVGRGTEHDITTAQRVGAEQRSINEKANSLRDKLNSIRERIIKVRDSIRQRFSRTEQTEQPDNSTRPTSQNTQSVKENSTMPGMSRFAQIQAEQKSAREKQSQDNAQEPQSDQKDSVREKLARFTQEAKEGRTEPLQSEKQEQTEHIHHRRGHHR